MKIIDIVVVLALAWYGYKGWKSGLVQSFVSIVALVVGGLVAVPLSGQVQKILTPTTEHFYLITLIGTFLLCIVGMFLIGKLFKVSFSFVLPDIIDNLLGATFGVLKVLFCAGCIFYCIESIDTHGKIITPESKSSSIIYKPSYNTARFLLPKITDFNTYLSNHPTVKSYKENYGEKLKNK